jgi:probable rRNA maturation factor
VPVQVVVVDEQSDRPVETERLGALARAVLASEGVEGEAELSVLFVDEQAIAALNERYLGRSGPTDVLSFPIDDEPAAHGGPPILLGDVVICPEVAWRNAPSHAGTYEDELALLVVHGILHVLGMDHEVPEEAEVMEAREQALLSAHHRRSS